MEILKDMSDTASIYVTLPHAEGLIEPQPEQANRLEEITTRLGAGEFHVPAQANLPVICIDGRYGGYHLLPNAAGGTETLMVADDLTFQNYAGEDGTTGAAFENVINRVLELGLPVGGHTDDHHVDGASGCGANDKLNYIYDFIARKDDVLKKTAATLGVAVPDEIHDMIVTNATKRTEFSVGGELLEALKNTDDKAIIEPLTGAHNEVVAIINTRPGTTLDRKALQDEFGSEYQAFNVDVWAFENGARALSDNPAEIQALVVAMVYYNVAVAHVLGGKSLRIIPLQ